MAVKKFNLHWLGVYKESTNRYYGGNNPIRAGGYDGYNSFLGFDSSEVLAAMQSSVTTPSAHLVFYVTDSGELDVGMHRETYNRKTSNGIPYYNWIGKSFTAPTGWNHYDLTNFGRSLTNYEGVNSFEEALEAGFRGPVLYRTIDEFYTEAYGYTSNSYHAYIEIHGTWNTPPSETTIAYPSGGEIFDAVHTVSANPATDNEQDQSQLKYQWAVSPGAGWYYYDWGAPGDTEKTIDFSEFRETSSAKVAVRVSDGELTSDYTHSNVFTIRHNKRPDIPTNLNPSGGEYIDRTQDQQFSWKHNDDEPQSGYEFQWREKGTTTWNAVFRLWNTEYYIAPANTFPVGEIEWRVSTIDQGGLTSDYSSVQIVHATEATDAPTIIRPEDNSTVTEPTPVIEWSSYAQAEYTVQLELGGNTLWEESKPTSVKALTLPYELENAQTYKIRVSVKSEDGLWSSFAEHDFTTSFTPPTQAILSASVFEDDGRIEIGINNPEPTEVTEPTVVTNEVYRTVEGEENLIKVDEGISNNGVYTDYTPGSGVLYEYVIRSWGENGTFVDSQAIIAAVYFSDTVLSKTSDYSARFWMKWNPERTLNKDLNRTLFKFNGRSNYVAEFEETISKDLDMNFSIREEESLQNIYDVLDSKETLLYRDGRGRRMFVTLGEYSLTEERSGGYRLSTSITEMDYREESN